MFLVGSEQGLSRLLKDVSARRVPRRGFTPPGSRRRLEVASLAQERPRQRDGAG